MAILINFFDNVILQAISEEIVPKVSFFKDRYFPTGAGDIFKANEVLTEYRSGDRKLAAFVDQKAGDIPIGRRSYEVHSYKPAYIAPSRLLTLDELTKRGFGEALYPGMDEAQRAARLLADDMNDMENRIARREEWMAAETMIGNGCVMQEYIDGATKGDSLVVKFYDGTSDHTYTASKKWNENGGDFWGDVKAMCRMLSARGLPAKDLILGTDVADYILTDERTRQLLDKNSGIIVGEIRQQLKQDADNRQQQQTLMQQIAQMTQQVEDWGYLNSLIGSKEGDKFRKFAQGLTLDNLVHLANQQLTRLHGRYLLQRKASEALEVEVVDTWQADAVRDTRTLSGGESFLVSLALALALSDLVSHKTRIDSLFLDEGFGTLDSETLDTALDALDALNASGKTIGVISHVEAMKERIPVQIKVKKINGLGYSKLESAFAVK